jgi:hypothetical protein
MSLFICQYCGSERKNKNSLSGHQRLCKNNPEKSFTPFMSEEFQKTKNGKKRNQYTKAKELGLEKPKLSDSTKEKWSKSSSGRKHTDETKNNLSHLRINFLKQNPDKHPWKKNTKFISAPCEYLKQFLQSNNIEFISEYMPLLNRMFSIDIALPTYKLGIEVNGNQHYNKDGTLKSYYQERHNLIESDGWILIELHYSSCYNENILNSLLYDIQKTILSIDNTIK